MSDPTAADRRVLMEVRKCRKSCAYFLHRYGHVLSEEAGEWVPFRLWPAQRLVLRALAEHRLVVALKARQLGMTWLLLGFVLWLVLFHPIATVLLFSRRDDEATDLLRNRLKGMYRRLPPWLRADPCDPDNDHEWCLANGSRVKAFPTGAGDSYTASFVLVDEADLVPDLGQLMRAVKPTIDAGGRMVLLSRPDKNKPESQFKRIYRGAKTRENPWHPIFLPWDARPGRDEAWRDEQRRDILQRTGSLDDLTEQYPATDTEALAPRTLDKRLPPAWLEQCYQEQAALALPPPGAPAIPGLEVFVAPVPGRKYVLGADPAEGNPSSDDSALTVLDAETGEECAALAGKFDPSVFAGHVAAVARWYNGALVLVERNNHGHAVLLWLRDNAKVFLLSDLDGKPGWNTTTKSKAQLWTTAADAFRDRQTVLHSFASYTQLSSIEGSTLSAPQGQHDDRATSYALALVAVARAGSSVVRVVTISPQAQAPTQPAPGMADIVWPSDDGDRW